ncbi:hypothetical protein TNCV_4745121 [Trichonephila clavipes]|nr:hypothetical protein TNCV_4745121 [Trichonephila clavipes]
MLSSRPGAIYQQDNARPHTARLSQQCLQGYDVLPWPARIRYVEMQDYLHYLFMSYLYPHGNGIFHKIPTPLTGPRWLLPGWMSDQGRLKTWANWIHDLGHGGLVL